VNPRRTFFLTRAAVALLCVLALAAPALAGAPPSAKDGDHPKLDKALARLALVGGESRVIIELEDGAPAALVTQGLGARLGRQLRTFKGTVAVVPNRHLEQLARHPLVKHVYLDRPTGGALNRTAVVVGARAVQQVMGIDGSGVGVAVIDSGITSWHDDLAGSGVGGQRVAAFVDFVNGRPTAYDDNGHGTHVAGVVAGNGYDTYGGKAGIAPGAHLIGLKVLDYRGAGNISDVIAALDWVVANKDAYNIRVANLSVGASITESYNTDPLALSAKAAVDAGIVIVAAAGNLGKNAAGAIQYGGITAPGNAPWVLTVGAYSHQGTVQRTDDVMAGYSSRGPTYIDFQAKPDLVAPGTGIISLADPQSTFYATKAALLRPGRRPTAYLPYLTLSGTSMAAPVVSGTVALMVQANPALTPNAVKAILQYTSQVYPGYDYLTQGAGFLNTRGAVRLARFFRTAAPGAHFPKSSAWARHILWGNHRVYGGVIMPSANAWSTNVVWGAERDFEGDNIVWGAACPSAADCQNIVWGASADLGENIVWGIDEALDNIVWGAAADGTDDNIVWGNYADDNIVWGVIADELDNIVWGNSFEENIVWGNDCAGADCDSVVWGTSAVEDLDGDNIVWGNSEGAENIVWGASGDIDNVVWGTSSEDDNMTWGNSAFEGAAFDDPAVDEEALMDPSVFESLFEPETLISPPDAPPPSPDSSITTTATAEPVSTTTTTIGTIEGGF
jgi:serine protease AprX